jgi:hypothetical protein
MGPNAAAGQQALPPMPVVGRVEQPHALQISVPDYGETEDDSPDSPTDSAEIERQVRRHTDRACAAFRTRFAERFPAMCRKDGIFIYSCRPVSVGLPLCICLVSTEYYAHNIIVYQCLHSRAQPPSLPELVGHTGPSTGNQT